MEHIQILFENINEDKKDLLVALLADIGFEGFQEENYSLKAFIQREYFDEVLFNNLIEINNIKYLKSIIKEENWNEKWESDFEPVKVYNLITKEPFVYIRANFHQPDITFLHDISVTPKMSFGTGHHATTQLMVEHMAQIDFNNKCVIDFGTGTGVLAIIAEKLGATNIVGIDNDEWSINNANENISVNSCKNITLVKAETIPGNIKGEIILANINLNIIKENIIEVTQAAYENATFLFSGIMLHDEDKIKDILKDAGLSIAGTYNKAGWLLLKAIN